MESLTPHTLVIESRKIAVYIGKENKWYPARDYQEEAVKDFIGIVERNLSKYKTLLDEGIAIPSEITKRYEPRQGIIFTISYDTTNNDCAYFINTYSEDFSSHLTTIYHTFTSETSLIKHPIISKIGTLSDELKAVVRNNKNKIN